VPQHVCAAHSDWRLQIISKSNISVNKLLRPRALPAQRTPGLVVVVSKYTAWPVNALVLYSSTTTLPVMFSKIGLLMKPVVANAPDSCMPKPFTTPPVGDSDTTLPSVMLDSATNGAPKFCENQAK
ncbi:MAG: hypothetical protein ACK56F_29570, partial [bacterium]